MGDPKTIGACMMPNVDQFLSDFVRRRRKLRATGIFCLICAWVLVWIMVVALIDRLMPLSSSVRLILLIVLGISVSWAAVRIARLFWVRRYNPILAAKQIEAMTPALQERLLTVVTQQSMSPAKRGSEELTQVLTEQVTEILCQRPPDTLITDRQIAPAVLLLFLAALLMMGLLFVPGLGLPRLVARQVAPWTDLPPVSRTQIQLITGDLDVPQGHSVAVVADITNGPGEATLFIGPSSDQMVPMNMSRTFADRFAITLSGIEQDMVYQVRSGDAVSSVHRLRILTRPMLAKLEIRLDYPAYLEQKPTIVESDNGMIRAPKGTDVTLTLYATEPLSDAVLDIQGQVHLTDPTPDPCVRSARFTVQNTGEWSITLVSERGIEAKGFENMQIQAIEDHPPVVRMLYSHLQIHPSEHVKLPFIVQDDLSIQDMFLQIELDEIPWFYQPVRSDYPRSMISDSVIVDLSAMDLDVGQMILVRLVATDRAGQTRASEPCRILLTPRSIHPELIRQTQMLRQAISQAQKVIDWPSAAKACQNTFFKMLQADNSTTFNNFLAVQIDRIHSILSAVDSGTSSLTPSDRQLLQELINDSQALYQSFLARQIRFTDLNRAELRRLQPTDSLSSVAEVFFELVRSERESMLVELGLDTSDPDLADKLQFLLEQEERIHKKNSVPTVSQIIRDWISGKDPKRQQARIEAVARMLSLRNDKDQIWLEDLRLILRAIQAFPDAPFPDLLETTQVLEKAHLEPTSDHQEQADRVRETLLTWLDERSEQNFDMDEMSSVDDHEASTESMEDWVWSGLIPGASNSPDMPKVLGAIENKFGEYEMSLKAYFRALEKSRSPQK
ncbi:MAG: hypothetical protein KatS3mg104_2255 [Phycisphaerae bacterium]|nr:MAG: hypothetical protein KatS3mg104_2255 [Phycisphaerae bacterium]